MDVSKSIQFRDFDKFVECVKKFKEEKKHFTFSGNITVTGEQYYNINWSSDEEV